MAPRKSLRETALWAILANRHPILWEEIIGPLGPLGPAAVYGGVVNRVALNPQPLPRAESAIGARYGLRTALAVVQAAGTARLLGVAFDDIPDICPPEPDPFPPLPQGPDPIPWRTALKTVPDFYADYALGLAIGLEATAGDWEHLPIAGALGNLCERAIGVAPVRE